jgi:hypothetical protein
MLTVGSDTDDGVVVAFCRLSLHHGKWQETTVVVVELGGPNETDTALMFAR